MPVLMHGYGHMLKWFSNLNFVKFKLGHLFNICFDVNLHKCKIKYIIAPFKCSKSDTQRYTRCRVLNVQ